MELWEFTHGVLDKLCKTYVTFEDLVVILHLLVTILGLQIMRLRGE